MNYFIIPEQEKNLTPNLLLKLRKKQKKEESTFKSIQALRHDQELYDRECTLLAKRVRGVSYYKSKKIFVARPYLNGKRVLIASDKNFDVVVACLNEYKLCLTQQIK